jgi:hypothetical protein
MPTNLFDELNGFALSDSSGYIYYSKGTTVPTDASKGYQAGCIFVYTSGTTNGLIYVNTGSTTSCSFKAIVVSGDNLTRGGLIGAYSAKTANYTMTSSDEVVSVNGTGAATTVIIKLPTASTAGTRYTFVNIASTAGFHVEGVSTATTINGSNSLTFDYASQYTSRVIVSNGTNYFVVGGEGNLT